MGRPKGFERSDVLDQALQLFWKKGFADTSLQDLEKATGVNKSGLYSEFKDKDEIYLECLKQYGSNSAVLELLNKQPLGWKNIKDFLKLGINCPGQKGCFMVNSLREFSIIPGKAKTLIESQIIVVKEALILNLSPNYSKKNASELADIILTFNTGLKLKLNAIKPEMVESEIDNFLSFVKS